MGLLFIRKQEGTGSVFSFLTQQDLILVYLVDVVATILITFFIFTK